MTDAGYERPDSCSVCGGSVGVLGFVLGRTHAATESQAHMCVLMCSWECLRAHIDNMEFYLLEDPEVYPPHKRGGSEGVH